MEEKSDVANDGNGESENETPINEQGNQQKPTDKPNQPQEREHISDCIKKLQIDNRDIKEPKIYGKTIKDLLSLNACLKLNKNDHKKNSTQFKQTS